MIDEKKNTIENRFKVDVLAFGAHPDDIVICCGGTIAKLSDEGKLTCIIDLNSGQIGTRGNSEIRLKEAEIAKDVLGVTFRENLDLMDGDIHIDDYSINKVIYVLRKYRPEIVLLHPPYERHPDHEITHKLVRTAMFKAGLQKIETKSEGKQQERFRIRKMFSYMQSYEFPRKPDFYVDISETFERKMESIKVYASQVYLKGITPDSEPKTRLNRPEFLEEIEARALYFGSLIGVRYAEAFLAVESVGISSISKLL